jgi:hypothetical protein
MTDDAREPINDRGPVGGPADDTAAPEAGPGPRANGGALYRTTFYPRARRRRMLPFLARRRPPGGVPFRPGVTEVDRP